MVPDSKTGWRALLAGGALSAMASTLIMICGCDNNTPRLSRVMHRIAIRAMRFEPAVVHVTVGDTVQWTNLDLVPHTATSGEGAFDSGNLLPDSFWALVVRRDGVLDYSCLYHTGMKGSIVAVR
jgi:plastocyanin